MRNNFIYDYFNVFSKARKLREDKSNRDRSVRFAISSIIFSLVTIACAVVGAFLLTLSDTGLLYVLLLVVAVGLLAVALVAFIGALLRVIAQFTINRNAMSWIALIILLVSAIVSVLLIIKFVG